MRKFVFLLATFALLLLLTNASIYRSEIRGGQMSCSEQMEQQDNLRHCQSFMEEECSSERCSCSCGGGSCLKKNTKHMMRCCQQLGEMDKQCRCRNLEKMVEQMMMRESMKESMKERMYEDAEGMLRMCSLQPMRCEMSSRSLFE